MGKKLTTEDFIKIANTVHSNKYDYSLVDYKNMYTKVKIICLKHGIFEQSPSNHIHSKQECPMCHGNKKMNILEFIEEYNLCIEYDGLQHFEPIDYWGGIETLKYIQAHDKIKTSYCETNNIKLIRIKYNRKLKSNDILETIKKWL